MVATETCLCFQFYRKLIVDKPPVLVAIGIQAYDMIAKPFLKQTISTFDGLVQNSVTLSIRRQETFNYHETLSSLIHKS